MKKLAFLLCFVILFSALCLFASADGSETGVAQQASSGGDLGTWEIMIVSIAMFTTISVIGVMFIKTVMKNKRR